MELDELKNIWTSLDERLKKQEILKESIIKEMLLNKSDKSLNRLSNFEWLASAAAVITLPLPLLLLKISLSTLQIILIAIFLVGMVYNLASQVWKVRTLMKVDFSNPVSLNIQLMERFNIHIKRNYMLTFFIFPLLAIFFAETIRISSNITIEKIVFLVAMLLFAIVNGIWQYKKIYVKNIHSILKSMESLKELEE